MLFRFIPTQRVIEYFKKIAKKFKKTKKYHYGSISSHHRLKEDEKEGKKKLSFRSVPTRRKIENSKKNSKKIKRIKKYHYGSISSHHRGWERRKRKIIVSFRSYLTHNRKFQKNSKKIQKKLKNHILAWF